MTHSRSRVIGDAAPAPTWSIQASTPWPTAGTNRPGNSRLTVAISIAASAGLRSGTGSRPTPTRIELLQARAAVALASPPSWKQSSHSHRSSRPTASTVVDVVLQALGRQRRAKDHPDPGSRIGRHRGPGPGCRPCGPGTPQPLRGCRSRRRSSASTGSWTGRRRRCDSPGSRRPATGSARRRGRRRSVPSPPRPPSGSRVAPAAGWRAGGSPSRRGCTSWGTALHSRSIRLTITTISSRSDDQNCRSSGRRSRTERELVTVVRTVAGPAPRPHEVVERARSGSRSVVAVDGVHECRGRLQGDLCVMSENHVDS